MHDDACTELLKIWHETFPERCESRIPRNGQVQEGGGNTLDNTGLYN